MAFEETIYFSLLDLHLHSLAATEITPQTMLDVNQKLLEESFSFNYSTEGIKLKSLK